MYVFFFFSSRRRHTRFDCEWSSDVCSSDLFRPPSPGPSVPRLVATDELSALGAKVRIEKAKSEKKLVRRDNSLDCAESLSFLSQMRRAVRKDSPYHTPKVLCANGAKIGAFSTASNIMISAHLPD